MVPNTAYRSAHEPRTPTHQHHIHTLSETVVATYKIGQATYTLLYASKCVHLQKRTDPCATTQAISAKTGPLAQLNANRIPLYSYVQFMCRKIYKSRGGRKKKIYAPLLRIGLRECEPFLSDRIRTFSETKEESRFPSSVLKGTNTENNNNNKFSSDTAENHQYCYKQCVGAG